MAIRESTPERVAELNLMETVIRKAKSVAIAQGIDAVVLVLEDESRVQLSGALINFIVKVRAEATAPPPLLLTT